MKRIFYILAALLIAAPAEAVTYTVAASSDDAQQVAGTMTLNGTTIGASLDATTDWAGMRWTGVTIPQAATILTEGISEVPWATTEDEPLVTIFIEDADSCGTFTTGASNISTRAMTSGTALSSTNHGANGATYFNSPSLVTTVQAVVNRAVWAGSAMCVLIQGGATSTRDLTIEAYDLGPGTNPPQLIITWSVPGACAGSRALMGVGC